MENDVHRVYHRIPSQCCKVIDYSELPESPEFMELEEIALGTSPILVSPYTKEIAALLFRSTCKSNSAHSLLRGGGGGARDLYHNSSC